MAERVSEAHGGSVDGGAGAQAGAGAQPPTPEQKRAVAAALSKMISASIGDIVVVLSRSSTHKHYSLADIEWMVLPAVVSGQFYVAEVSHNEGGFRAPLAVVTWAKVSAEVDARLSAGGGGRHVQLRPEEWTSGETLWLIDMAGDRRGLNSALRTLQDGPFKDKQVKVAARDASGAVNVETLAELMAAAGSSNQAGGPAA